MKEFTDLIETIDKIINNCEWSCRQNLKSLQPYLLEEVHEVIEAIDLDLDEPIREELGDMLYTLLFCAKIAEKDKRFGLTSILSNINEKLIRRHPHVFNNLKVHSIEEIAENWQKIKKTESKGVLSGISENLPSLARAQKILHRLKANGFPRLKSELLPLDTEEQIANSLIDVLMTADSKGIDVEGALRRKLAHLQLQFESWENS
ncbi:MazG nucleotide pyrophosphohydrolase domain-containing protein [Candidatus Rhabdochlamydia sp. T3358]|uniref:MazG nucleotide pyrophosphohydrolase domain-containing protein n=1 Tax=Candidatus Rhabdochlamydia sp. T3358 TaxID=2099795 RepID=UPI0010BBC0CB|nr:MazG nucleotide pyrophosphohydrolase domain-containing protein [Candidatus Rhabdochlamydia sp. T3358]VHO02435.1 Nucleoside triphosphate pyrophosphohydrolase [Candidatus Rhabdochlamydia sp. T3358]